MKKPKFDKNKYFLDKETNKIVNKSWHPLTIQAFLESEKPGIIKYNWKNNIFEVLLEK